MIWRWDQGRLLYFQFDVLKQIASVLNGVSLSEKGFDPLRFPLEEKTGMPFSPSNYKVWRNYKRVFECSFLATTINDKLQITDFCQEIIKKDGLISDIDDFLCLYIPRFRFPFPAFQEFSPNDSPIYPFCAILKFLLAKRQFAQEAFISIDEVFSIIIGNNCTGLEPLEFYLNLKPQSINIIGDQKRQVREMLIFASQLTILKWYNNHLFLDISDRDIETASISEKLITPIIIPISHSREEDYLRLTKITDKLIVSTRLQSRETATDELFIEGKKKRVTHLKIERSPFLRKMFVECNPLPICHMCGTNMTIKYPWTNYLIEIHHVLPLSSSLGITTKGTSIDDIVGLCPSCHKGVHIYYRNWLNDYKCEDFESKNQAKHIYLQAKNAVVL